MPPMTGTGDISYRTAGFVCAELLKRAQPLLAVSRLGQNKPIPKNSGDTIKFRGYEALDTSPKVLIEGVTPTASKPTFRDVVAKLEQYGENLSALEGVLEDSPELVRLFHIPVISVAEKQKVLSQVLDKLDVDPMIKNFCSLLAEKERLPLFEEIAEAFGKLLTAVSLSKEQQAGILARLEKQTSKQIALKFEVDPSILGGVVLQVGDNVLDASLRAQLAILRDIIKRGE